MWHVARPIDRDVYRAPLVVGAGPYVPVPLPEGLFMVGDGIYYANAAGAYCVFPDWATYVRITGRTDVVGVPRPDAGRLPSLEHADSAAATATSTTATTASLVARLHMIANSPLTVVARPMSGSSTA